MSKTASTSIFAGTSLSRADAIRRTPAVRALENATAIVAFTAATALSARVLIPLPDTPVPITLQTLVVTLAALSLGPWRGMLSMALYLLIGAAGFQVFAGGNWGFQTLLGATGGYLIGFLLAQPVAAWVAAAGRSGAWRWLAALLSPVAAHAVIFACGVPWLAFWLNVDAATSLDKGFWPFVAGSALLATLAKCGAATALSGAAARLRSRLDR